MGDVSVLSHAYKVASELSHSINQAVIALKKTCWGLPGAEAITPEQVDTHRHGLAALLEAFAALLAPTGAHRLDETMAATIPGALIARLQAERRGDLAYYVDDLQHLVAHLREGPARLAPGDFDLLDQLASAADAETSSVFRRLLRA